MSGTTLAREHADTLAAMIGSNAENGHPFGLNEDGDAVTVWEFLADALAVEVVSTLNGDYLGARVLIATGGPSVVVVDTQHRTLEVAWWCEPVRRPLPDTLVDALDAAIRELVTEPVGGGGAR